MSRFDLVVFDLDGTLIDSRPDVADALNRALAAFGLPPYAEADLDRMIGRGSRWLVEQALAGLAAGPTGPARALPSVDTAWQRFQHEYWAAPVVRTRPYPGVVDGMAALSSLALAVATNKPGDLAREVVGRLGLAPRFLCVLGDGDVPERKPAPDMLREAMRRAGSVQDRTLYVGDGPVDVQTAGQAGVALCLVEWGYPGRPLTTDAPRAARFHDVVRLALDS